MMRLTLVVNNTSALEGGAKATAVFDPGGGTVGSAGEAAWRLVDCNGGIAAQHLDIVHMDDAFCAKILAEGGLRVNGGKKVLGRGEIFRLTDGDELLLGPFSISAYVTFSLDGEDRRGHRSRWARRFASVGQLIGGKGADVADEDLLDAALAEEKHRRRRRKPREPASSDPLDLMGRGGGGEAAVGDPLMAIERTDKEKDPPMNPDADEILDFEIDPKLSAPDDRQPSSAHFDMPQPGAGAAAVESERGAAASGEEIDAYLESLAAAAPQHTLPPERTRDALVRGSWLGEVADGEAQEAHIDHVVLRPLCEGLGLPVQELTGPQADRLAREIGTALRAAIEGLMELQASGGQGAAHLSETRLHAIEDNPLRFSQAPERTIHDLFLVRSPVHLAAGAAISESLVLQRHHRDASAAATQAALEAVLEALSPLALARRFKNYKGHAPRAGDLDAWHWTMYQHYYAEMRSGHQGGLSRMFREVHAQVYDREMRARTR